MLLFSYVKSIGIVLFELQKIGHYAQKKQDQIFVKAKTYSTFPDAFTCVISLFCANLIECFK